MANGLLPFLRLVRLPNVVTAMADILAGYALAHGRLPLLATNLWALMLASACIYAGGCALNDLRDLDIDRVRQPSRPLPSGAVSQRAATLLTVLLLAGGWGLTALAGAQAWGVASLLVALVLVYDCRTKHLPLLGSLTMAACRGANLALGMAPSLSLGPLIIFPLISSAYVFWLTALSQFENSGAPRSYAQGVLLGLAATLGAPLGLVASGRLSAQALAAMGLLLLVIAPPVLAWWRDPTAQHAGRAVKFLVLGLPLLNAVYVSGIQGWSLALPLLACVPLTLATARYMYVN